MATVAIIPSYRPDGRLLDLVRLLGSHGIDAVVVDDGSGDGYRALFKRAKEHATIIGYQEHAGRGHALKCGLAFVGEHYDDDTVVVTFDEDVTYNFVDILRCAHAARRLPGTLVLGCRSFEGMDVGVAERLSNRLARGLCQMASGSAPYDMNASLRAFTASLIPLLARVPGERNDYETNVLLECPVCGIDIHEVPIHTMRRDGRPAGHTSEEKETLPVIWAYMRALSPSALILLLDYALFGSLWLALGFLGGTGLILANSLARVVSASFGFLLRQSILERGNETPYATAVRYALRSLGILVCDGFTVLLLVDLFGMPVLLAKLLTEVLFAVAACAMRGHVRTQPTGEVVHWVESYQL